MRGAFICSVLLLPLVSCGTEEGGGTVIPPDAAQGTPGDAARVDASAACTSHSLPRELQIEFDGDTRRVILAGPTDLPESPVPLVLNFHGYSDDSAFQEGLSLMSEDAIAGEYVVAYPEGTGIVKGWNAGSCCGTAVSSGKKDVEFTERVIEEIAALACVDRNRVYAVGYSNGGFLSHRLACERSDKIAGIASVAGVIGTSECAPTRAIPVLQMHGTFDTVVAYDGNVALGFPSVSDTMAGWSQRLHCDDAPPSAFFENGDTTCVRYSGCDAPLGLCTIEGGGHTWPGGSPVFGRGTVSSDLDANAVMMEFLGGSL